jgi:hypothetical protein
MYLSGEVWAKKTVVRHQHNLHMRIRIGLLAGLCAAVASGIVPVCPDGSQLNIKYHVCEPVQASPLKKSKSKSKAASASSTLAPTARATIPATSGTRTNNASANGQQSSEETSAEPGLLSKWLLDLTTKLLKTSLSMGLSSTEAESWASTSAKEMLKVHEEKLHTYG